MDTAYKNVPISVPKLQKNQSYKPGISYYKNMKNAVNGLFNYKNNTHQQPPHAVKSVENTSTSGVKNNKYANNQQLVSFQQVNNSHNKITPEENKGILKKQTSRDINQNSTDNEEPVRRVVTFPKQNNVNNRC